MTRTPVLLLLAGALCFTFLGCGGGDAPKAAADSGAKADAPADDHAGHDHAPGEGHDAPADEHAGHDHAPGEGHEQEGEIGGTGMEHKEGTVAGEDATFTVGPENPDATATTSDGWTVKVVSNPATIAVGPVSWQVSVTAPGGAAVTPGQLLIEPTAQESNTGKKLPLEVTPGDPGQATVSFMIEAAGTYEVEFHLHRSDGGDSHVKAVFTVA